jgi:hypothetical protein
MNRELMQQALDALKHHRQQTTFQFQQTSDAVKALEAELAKPEQEPVAWMLPDYGDVLSASEADGTGIYNIPLYTAPPKRKWVGLTDDEIKEVLDLNVTPWSLSGVALQHVMDDARALEAKLKEKNNAI